MFDPRPVTGGELDPLSDHPGQVRKESTAMATDMATREFSAGAKELGDKIVGLTLKQAKELSDYLEEVHGIKPAAGGGPS